jgi:hypothetical protein
MIVILPPIVILIQKAKKPSLFINSSPQKNSLVHHHILRFLGNSYLPTLEY